MQEDIRRRLTSGALDGVLAGALSAALAFGALLLLAGGAAAADTNSYTEGTAGDGFSIERVDGGWSWDQGAADESLTLSLDGLPPLSTPAVTSVAIKDVFSLGGQPAEKVGFVKFVLHVDIDIDAAFNPLPVVSYTSRRDGSGFQDANVSYWGAGVIEFEPRRTNYGELPGGDRLTYQVSFQVPSGGASGTITVHDFTLVYGEYVAPPDGDGDGGGGGGGGGDGGGGEDDDDKAKPSGVAYMGGSGDGSGSGGGSGSGSGTGTGSGQGAGNSAGVRVGEGGGSIDTDAPVTASPRSSAGDTVTGYPLRLDETMSAGGGSGAGVGGGSGGSGGGTEAAGGGGGLGLSWEDAMWVAVGLAIATPFAIAAMDRRRVRRRLRDLVDETPDGPAPRVTAPA